MQVNYYSAFQEGKHHPKLELVDVTGEVDSSVDSMPLLLTKVVNNSVASEMRNDKKTVNSTEDGSKPISVKGTMPLSSTESMTKNNAYSERGIIAAVSNKVREICELSTSPAYTLTTTGFMKCNSQRLAPSTPSVLCD